MLRIFLLQTRLKDFCFVNNKNKKYSLYQWRAKKLYSLPSKESQEGREKEQDDAGTQRHDPSESEVIAGIAGVFGGAAAADILSSMCVSRSRTEDMWIDEDDVEYTLNPSGEGGRRDNPRSYAEIEKLAPHHLHHRERAANTVCIKQY